MKLTKTLSALAIMLLAASHTTAQVRTEADWYESLDVLWTLSEEIKFGDKTTLQSPNAKISRDNNGSIIEIEITHSGTSNFHVDNKINFTGRIMSATKGKNSKWYLKCAYGNALVTLSPPLGPAKFNGVTQSLSTTSSCNEIKLIPDDGMAVLERGCCAYMVAIYRNEIIDRREFRNQTTSLTSSIQDANNIIEIARGFDIDISAKFLMTVNEPNETIGKANKLTYQWIGIRYPRSDESAHTLRMGGPHFCSDTLLVPYVGDGALWEYAIGGISLITSNNTITDTGDRWFWQVRPSAGEATLNIDKEQIKISIQTNDKRPHRSKVDEITRQLHQQSPAQLNLISAQLEELFELLQLEGWPGKNL
jgi:hypothetical protein